MNQVYFVVAGSVTKNCLSGPVIHELTFLLKDDSDDESVHTQDTRHDDWDDRSQDQVRPGDTHGTDPHSTLGRSVG